MMTFRYYGKKSSTATCYLAGILALKSLPLHFIRIFSGETCQGTKIRFELLNNG